MKNLSRIGRYLGVLAIIALCSLGQYANFFQNYHNPPSTILDETILGMTEFENKFYDYKVKHHLDSDYVDPNVVWGDMSDRTLQSVGRWPWSRAVWEKMIDRFNHFGAKVIALDAMFPEPEKACNAKSPDIGFARSIQDFQAEEGKKVIIGYEGTYYKDESNKDQLYTELPEILYNYMIDYSQAKEDVGFEEHFVSKGTFPIPQLLEVEPGVAYIMSDQDSDGVFRNYNLVQNFHEFYVPSMALMAYQEFTGKKTKLTVDGNGDGILEVNGHVLNLNNKGQTKVRFRGSQAHFKHVDLADVYFAKDDDNKMKEIINGKLIVVGSSATGAHDLRNTPIDPLLPGVFFHINMTSQLINNYFFKELGINMKVSILIFLGAILLLLAGEFFNNALLDLSLTITIMVVIFLSDKHYFFPKGYDIRLFYTFAVVGMIYIWNTFINFYISNKEKKQIKGAFSRYLAPSIVNDMLEHPEKLRVGGEKRNITVFFSDVRDFTSISEQLSANDLAMVINRYMGEMTDILFEYKGTLDKYIGDAIVGFWNAPLDIADHPQLAVEASIAMIEALPAINKEFEEQGFPEFKIGIGLNTGDCNVGNMGSDAIFAYTALGDAMNLGARLEGLCKFYGSMITISEYTYALIDHEKITCRKLDKVRVKGKLEPVEIYEVLHSTHNFMIDKEAYDNFQIAYGRFHAKNFQGALNIFTSLSEKYPEDKASIRFKGMCEDFIETPPEENWDGVYTFNEK
jgi:adenylate cyclase